jgi:hypothetical protein
MIQNSDGIKAEDAKAMGFVVPEGVRDYFITSDQHLWQLSERKKKVLQNIQDLMKTNAVDCKINIYENGDDGLGCITLPGTPQQYAFHPELKKDIAETSTRFPDSSLQKETAGEAATDDAFAAAAAEPLLAPPAGAEGAAAAPVAAAAPPPPPAPKKRKIQGFIIDYEGVPYIAEPVLQKGQTVPLSYDLYARGDIKRTKKLGVALADMDGNPTADIEMF